MIIAIEIVFPVFLQPDINTGGVGRILDSCANPRLRLGFAQQSRIHPAPVEFISGYTNTEKRLLIHVIVRVIVHVNLFLHA